MNPVVQIQQVTKRYGEVQALSDVTLKLSPGVTGLLGPNGSGKSTLIKALLGLVRAQSGTGTILDHAWPADVRTIRDLVGYLPEDDCYIAGLSGIQSISFMARLSGLPGTEAMRRAHEIADYCDLAEERYRTVESYSTGMRQKLKFAQALVHDPPLLILDEPTTGLDPDQRESMLRRIRNLATVHGKSVILSTHILPDVRAVCDYVVMLVGGTVRIVDSLEHLSEPSEPTVHVSVHGDADAFIERVADQGYNVERQQDGSLDIGGVEPDAVNEIWRLAGETETSIRQLSPAMNSLDQIFYEATVGDRQNASA